MSATLFDGWWRSWWPPHVDATSGCSIDLRALSHLGEFDPAKYLTSRRLEGEAVLLIDDTWTTGASAQSAAASLVSAGAGTVAAVVIGRHINREWGDNDARLRALPRFGWDTCALCAATAGGPAAQSALAAEPTAP